MKVLCLIFAILNHARLSGQTVSAPAVSSAAAPTEEQTPSARNFAQHVFPLLQSACLECHGPLRQEGGLRFDQESSVLDSGAVLAGKPEESELIRRIELPENHPELMPSKGRRLSASQVSLLRQWILDGAHWPENFQPPGHWAYTAPVRPPDPKLTEEDAEWIRSPLDAFVVVRMREAGFHPAPIADPDMLLRRVFLDLIGLPPTPAETESFRADPSEEHYTRLVNDLLGRPQFGEKWARHWLDLARYADSHGFQRDDLRDNWAWRDWVIQAMNSDMPFDQFTIEQLAGDLLPDATESQKIATGFHRCSPTNCEAGSLPEETRAEQLIDRVNTTSTVWLGTTMECVQCHDHKYDPFTMLDYYRLLAYFNNTAIEADRTNPNQPSSIAFRGPSMPISNPERDTRRRQLENQLQTAEQQWTTRREEFKEDLESWVGQFQSNLDRAAVTHPLEIRDFRSTGNTDAFEQLPDGSVLLTGDDPPEKDVYTLSASTSLKGISAFRLDALLHESLPGMGPGRGDPKRTNFVLNELTVSVTSDGREPRVLTFASAMADFSQKSWDVSGAVDGNPKTGWAIGPQFSRPHWAVFVLGQPLDADANMQLTFQLHQNFGGARTLGCFRISAITGDPDQGSEAVSGQIAAIAAKAPVTWTSAERDQLAEFRLESDREAKVLKRRIASLKRDLTPLAADTTLVMVEETPRPSHLFVRGDYRQPGEPVTAGTPAALHAPIEGPPNRLTLARWLADRRNPLVARVTVNRWWAEIFGRGLVATPEDFGIKGERPTHPELLDWLAVELMDHGWSMKHVLRSIVHSSVYRQSSRLTPELLERDDQNVWLARGPRFRLDAEAVRDHALAAAGLLNLQQFGPPIRPVQPEGLWAKVGGQQYEYLPSDGGEQYRRGIYIVHKRSAPNPSLMNFDGSSRLTCAVRRSRTNTPLQALTLLNDPVYVEMARALARRVLTELPERPVAEQIQLAFQLCTSRRPSAEELQILQQLLHDQRLRFSERSAEARTITGDDAARLGGDEATLAAWYSLTTVLQNLHETITKP